jgi:hypothetical protein
MFGRRDLIKGAVAGLFSKGTSSQSSIDTVPIGPYKNNIFYPMKSIEFKPEWINLIERFQPKVNEFVNITYVTMDNGVFNE